MEIAGAVYAVVRNIPKQEEYRFASQLVRAAISIPATIAQGHARATRKDYALISMARGSAAELATLLLLAVRAKFLDATAVLLEQVDRVARMLNRPHAWLKDG